MWHFLSWCSDYHQSLIFPRKRKCGQHVLSCQHKKNIRSKTEGLGDFPMFFYVISSESKREILLEEGLRAFWGWEAYEVRYTLVGSVSAFSLNPGLFKWSYDPVCIVPRKGRNGWWPGQTLISSISVMETHIWGPFSEIKPTATRGENVLTGQAELDWNSACNTMNFHHWAGHETSLSPSLLVCELEATWLTCMLHVKMK